MLRAFSEIWLGKPNKAIELTEGLSDEVRSLYNLYAAGGVMMLRGWSLAEFGRIDDGIEIINDGIELIEKFGESLNLSRLYNTLGYCFQEIYHPNRAWALNIKGRDLAMEIAGKYPMGRQKALETAAQAEVNLMENLSDSGRIDEAWQKIETFREVSKSDDYIKFLDQRDSRMNYLAAQIMLHQGKIAEAETFIKENLERVRKRREKKREGGLLRLLGEVQMRQNQADTAIANFNESIEMLKEVGNPRQLWQANASLGSAFDKLGRFSEAKHQWGAASEVIHKTANGLSDKELREGFLNAGPIKNILAKAER
jgi:tetratricopeptide (TPR) repeat protein